MFRKGDLVRHDSMPSWGIGSIKSAPKGGNLLIKFEQAGEKRIHPAYAALTKVPDEELIFIVVRETRFKWGRSLETTRIIPVVKQYRNQDGLLPV